MLPVGEDVTMEDRQLGGIGFLVANTAMFANGLIASVYAPTPQSRKAGLARMTSSGLWSGNALMLARYGNQPVQDQQARLEEKLSAYLQGQGVPLDVASLQKADRQTQHGLYQKLEDYLYAHPIECGNAYYATASTGYAISGRLRQQDGNRQAGNANLGFTALSMTAALASILIPERTPEQVAAQGQQGTLWGKIQEHPSGYVRWLFLGADVLAGMEGVGEYRAAKKLPMGDRYRAWQFGMAGLSVAAMGMAMVSDWLTSGSKKAGGTPEARAQAQQIILQEAATHLAVLPPEHQQQLALTVATYLTQQHELRFQDQDPAKLAALLLQQVHHHQQAPVPQPIVSAPIRENTIAVASGIQK